MILNNQTIDGQDIKLLTFSSRAYVLRICDKCGEEKEVAWNDLARCRKKHNRIEDYCFKCSMIIYNTGDNNPSKRLENRLKISEVTRGKSKKFKDGINQRILLTKIMTSGHIAIWSEEDKKYIAEHRLIMAQHKNIMHQDLQNIHHIDGNKTNNNINNLIELSNSEHTALHGQLNNIAFELVKNNFIIFDRYTNKYKLSDKLQSENMEKSYGFENIAIKQKKNICNSRLDADTTSEIIKGVRVNIPLIVSNMSTVINSDFYIKAHKLGAFGILHRADSKENIITEISKVSKECQWAAASIGIEEDQFDFAKNLIKAGCNILNIDVAHGYSENVFNLAKKLKIYAPSVKLIVGNTNNPDMILECFEFADAVKIGIGQGYACETKNTAGCTEKQFSTILKFKHISKKFGIPVISDGGTREPADLTKAVGAGANSVIAGSIFAACPESAGEIVNVDGKNKKLYAGMASEYVQNKWKGGLKSGTCAEGGIRYLDIGNSIEKVLELYSGALRSGITYAGAKDIQSFQDNVEFIILK